MQIALQRGEDIGLGIRRVEMRGLQGCGRRLALHEPFFSYILHDRRSSFLPSLGLCEAEGGPGRPVAVPAESSSHVSGRRLGATNACGRVKLRKMGCALLEGALWV